MPLLHFKLIKGGQNNLFRSIMMCLASALKMDSDRSNLGFLNDSFFISFYKSNLNSTLAIRFFLFGWLIFFTHQNDNFFRTIAICMCNCFAEKVLFQFLVFWVHFSYDEDTKHDNFRFLKVSTNKNFFLLYKIKFDLSAFRPNLVSPVVLS